MCVCVCFRPLMGIRVDCSVMFMYIMYVCLSIVISFSKWSGWAEIEIFSIRRKRQRNDRQNVFETFTEKLEITCRNGCPKTSAETRSRTRQGNLTFFASTYHVLLFNYINDPTF